MKTRLCVAVLAVALLCCTAVLAEAPKYTFVQVGYVSQSPDLIDNGTGWFAGGSFGMKNFQFFLDYEQVDFDPKLTTWALGGGWHGLFGENGDLVADLGYLNFDINEPGADSENGWFGRLGIRWRIIKFLEVNGYLTQTEPSGDFKDVYDEFFGKTKISVGALAFLGRVGLGLNYYKANESDGWNAFVRFQFGKN